MASEYDALLTEPTPQKSEYDQLLAPAQPEERSIPSKIGHAVLDTVKGFLPQSVEQAALAPITAVPGIGKVGQLLSNVAFGKPIAEGLDPLAGIPVAQRIPQIAAAEQTAPYSQERFTAGIGTLADVAMLAGFKGLAEAPKLAEVAGIAKPEIAPEPPLTAEAKAAPITPAPPPEVAPVVSAPEPDLTAVNRELAPVTESPEARAEPFPSISRSAEDVRRVEQQQAPPTVREAISLDELRLMRERGDLQLQNDISRRMTGGTHPAVDERLGQIDEELTNIANKELQPVGTEPVPTQGGELNAQQISEPTQIHGDVLNAPGTQESVREVPTAVGSEGVQTRGQGENVQQAPQEVTPTGITPEAQKLVDSGGVPGFVSKNLERIATENGITDIGKKTPNQIIDELKAKSVPSVPEATTAAPLPKEETPPPKTEAVTPVVSDQTHVSTIANRFTQERAAQGELGEIAPGQGYTAKDMAAQGLKMTPEQINQHVSDLMNETGNPIEQGKAVRAEEARLSQRSNELSRAADADPTNVQKKLDADNAFKDITDFHNGPVAKLKTVFHATGESLQGELPVDLSTFNGLRESYLREVGKAPPVELEPKLRQMADKVSNAVAEDNGAKTKLGQEIERVTSKRKLPTADEVRQSIADRMKVEPCRV